MSKEKIEECKALYDDGWLLEEITKYIHSNPKIVGKKLRKHFGIDTRKNSHKRCSKKVVGYKNDEIIEFSSLSSAARFFVENGISKSNNVQTVISKIHSAISNPKYTAYGYKWSYKTD